MSWAGYVPGSVLRAITERGDEFADTESLHGCDGCCVLARAKREAEAEAEAEA